RLGVVASVDPVGCTVDVTKARASSDVHPQTAFVDPSPIAPGAKREALKALAASVIRNGIDGAGPYRAARDILLRLPPRLAGGIAGVGQIRGLHDDEVNTAIAVGHVLQFGALPVQGPPGAGKTYTGARMICDLVRVGKRVGVTAHSHRAISNLLKETLVQSRELGVDLR